MTLLPIVERELRVACRRRGTYWLRFVLVVVISLLWFLLLTMLPGTMPLQRGPTVFRAMATLAFSFCLLAGVFLTSDCLSEEKREGTLGLLFLTELKGYDIVLGKLLATSLHAFYGLLAVFPVFALALLIGGVTAGEFWRLVLALLSTLVLSLSVGLLISALSRDTRQATMMSLLLLLSLAGLPVLVGWLAGFSLNTGVAHACFWFSPAFSYWLAFDGHFQNPSAAWIFVGSLVTVSAMGATSLWLASRYLPQRWAEKTPAKSADPSGLYRGTSGKAGYLGRQRALDFNPFFWLTTRDRLPRRLTWVMLGVLFPVCLGLVAGCLTSGGNRSRIVLCAAMAIAFAIHQGLKWLLASEASRRLSEDRHTGALELLLVTPLTVAQIIEGQRRALRSLFLGPMLFALAANAALFGVVALTDPAWASPGERVILAEVFFCGALLLLVDAYASSWIGMRMAFQTRRHYRAIFATLTRVLLLPWVAILFLALLIMGGTGLGPEALRVFVILWFGLAAVLVLSLAARAKGELLEAFRHFSTESNSPLAEPTPESIDGTPDPSLPQALPEAAPSRG